MNSKSNSFKCHDNCNKDKCCHEQKWSCDIDCCNTCHCVPGHPLPNSSILSCGTGSGLTIPAVAPGTIVAPGAQFNPIPVASVTIDTTCLCNPGVKIHFSSIINYQALLTLGALPILTTPFTVTFQLSKTCDNGSKIALGSWTFTQAILAVAVNITKTFSFTFCECNTCPGCCVYTVDIVNATRSALLDITLTTETASIVTSSLTAIASSSC
ncbi:MAG: DUF4489 domain-containing protein [Clostridium argentinense]|uniref:DUF4489 domain-containing protein n=1 Tax=Clostridium faecium TaxID=2762223 RepID=A0ABR8YQR9_9CLOT|nr:MULTISPECIES: DUF4489 domain-containing protein [Clostridium]MBD8046566.1 DUF4489 domain-containing protein [Clostridium faecium]MBS5822753.1 DUF4489 domain-containing protein [Clostridium argentinense]MDU1348109.1 DUF4489 domain-containing protein [Clostridium argentinense]